MSNDAGQTDYTSYYASTLNKFKLAGIERMFR